MGKALTKQTASGKHEDQSSDSWNPSFVQFLATPSKFNAQKVETGDSAASWPARQAVWVNSGFNQETFSQRTT